MVSLLLSPSLFPYIFVSNPSFRVSHDYCLSSSRIISARLPLSSRKVSGAHQLSPRSAVAKRAALAEVEPRIRAAMRPRVSKLLARLHDLISSLIYPFTSLTHTSRSPAGCCCSVPDLPFFRRRLRRSRNRYLQFTTPRLDHCELSQRVFSC